MVPSEATVATAGLLETYRIWLVGRASPESSARIPATVSVDVDPGGKTKFRWFNSR
jgi:hypothetical protein